MMKRKSLISGEMYSGTAHNWTEPSGFSGATRYRGGHIATNDDDRASEFFFTIRTTSFCITDGLNFEGYTFVT